MAEKASGRGAGGLMLYNQPGLQIDSEMGETDSNDPNE